MWSKKTINGPMIDKKWLAAFIPILFMLVALSNYLHLDILYLQVQISQSYKKNLSVGTPMLHFLIVEIIGEFLDFIKSVSMYKFIATSYRTGMNFFFQECISLRYKSFSRVGVGSLHHAVQKRATGLVEFLTALCISLISNVFFLVFVLLIITKELGWMASMRLLGVIVFFLVASIIAQKKRSSLRVHINEAVEDNTAKTLDVLMNYERIIAFDNIEVELQRYSKIMDKQVYYKKIYEITYEIFSFGIQAFLSLLICLIFYEFSKIDISPEKVFSFTLISMRLKDIVHEISKDIDHVFVSYTNLMATSLRSSDFESKEQGIDLNTFKSGMTVDRLNFSYKSGPILKNISCHIKKGEKIAITGANGSGKSTFIRILSGLYDYGGSIRIDGVELSKIDKKSVHTLMGYIPQSSYLFNKSVLENLSNGNKSFSEGQIIEYAKKYGYHDLFAELGYDKIVGERGSNISGGQRQKLCFLRAMLRNSPIIFMDKACSSMDSKSEMDIVRLIHKNMENRTVLNIVDSMTKLGFYDRIFHFGKNTLLESGRFKDLMAKKGYFHNFYNNMKNE